ncbi:MAG: hypothetical protein LBC62_00965 [Treponema sp.]|jgi:hypothetical protein|nr:hypothetical protein [Treponema sp.]
MVKFRPIRVFLLAAGLLFSLRVFSQEAAGILDSGAIPEMVRRPQHGEAPRYPRDTVIGELGRGSAPEAAWRYARELLSALVQGNREAPVLAAADKELKDRLFGSLEAVGAEKYRLGGGRTEADGSVSFLVRFLGGEKGISGELYLMRADTEPAETAADVEAVPDAETAAGEGGAPEAAAVPGDGWQLEDLLLEEERDLAGEQNGYRYDFSPYERFY